MSTDSPRIVEWYRVDETRLIAAAAIKGSLLLMAGCFCIGAALSGVVSSDPLIRILAGAFGSVCTVGGPALTIVGFQKIVSQEVYLALRSDGLYLHTADRKELVAWDDVEDARPDEAGNVIIQRKDAGPLCISQRFGDLPPRELCTRIQAIRRKAQWNLLARSRG